MAKCLCSVSKPWFFILLLFLYSVQKRIDTQKNESERARKAFCYCFSFLSILNLHVYINLNFTRLRFEFDITWLNVCVLKTLNFRLLIFLLFCLEKRINVPKKTKNNENERAGKAFYSCSNFLSISNLLINLNFVRARFEFNIKWLNVCDLKTLNFRLLSFLLFYIKKRINVQKLKTSVHVKPFVRCHCCCRRHCDCLSPKVGKTYRNKRQTFSASGLFFIKRHPTKYMHIEKKEPTTL